MLQREHFKNFFFVNIYYWDQSANKDYQRMSSNGAM